jgi:aflatoxin B1 aldehyde reductase
MSVHTATQRLGKPPLRIVLGTASFGSARSPFATVTTVDDARAILNSFRGRGYMDVDTARAYPLGYGGTSEELLGEPTLGLHKWANVSTKVLSFFPGSHRHGNLVRSISQSLSSLGLGAVDILYLHSPDPVTPLVDTCRVIHEAFLEGKFERFGLSNFSADQVNQVLQTCHLHGFVAPTVYQGQYNCLCRTAELELFPLLRKHRISFYAYSPMAGGFLVDPSVRVAASTNHIRWQSNSPLGVRYRAEYIRPAVLAVASGVRHAAMEHGLLNHAAALRWIVWHSALVAEMGDAVILGASNVSQLRDNLDIVEQGPLPQTLIEAFEQGWQDIMKSGDVPEYLLGAPLLDDGVLKTTTI